MFYLEFYVKQSGEICFTVELYMWRNLILRHIFLYQVVDLP
jgi:hypothetical protein